MKNLINKLTAALSSAVLFAAAVTMTGLGFALVAALAVFAFMALAVALLSAPFIGLAQDEELNAQDETVAA